MRIETHILSADDVYAMEVDSERTRRPSPWLESADSRESAESELGAAAVILTAEAYAREQHDLETYTTDNHYD